MMEKPRQSEKASCRGPNLQRGWNVSVCPECDNRKEEDDRWTRRRRQREKETPQKRTTTAETIAVVLLNGKKSIADFVFLSPDPQIGDRHRRPMR